MLKILIKIWIIFFFLYNGEKINEDQYNSSLNKFVSKNDKKIGLISVITYDLDNSEIDSISSMSPKHSSKISFINNDNGVQDNSIDYSNSALMTNILEENLIERNRFAPHILIMRKRQKRFFYLNLFKILLIQYICIVLFSWLGFLLKLNEFIIKNNITSIIKKEIIPVVIVLIIMSIIPNIGFINFRKNKYLIIYHVLYVLFAIYFSN